MVRRRLVLVLLLLAVASATSGSVAEPPSDGLWVAGTGAMTLQESLIAQAAADPDFADQAIAMLSAEQPPPDVDVEATVATLRELRRDPAFRAETQRRMAERYGVVYRPADSGPAASTSDESRPTP